MKNTVTLYRPVGQTEWNLINATGRKAFPPRLDWQPIFYPVTNREYAAHIAREWNTADAFSSFVGHVLMFEVNAEYIRQFEIHNVGGHIHDELWIPSSELAEFNKNILGEVQLVESFYGEKFVR
jgi:hypothetical protein